MSTPQDHGDGGDGRGGRGDPRLEIPEILRDENHPAKGGGAAGLGGTGATPGGDSGMAGMARAWAIAIDFIATILVCGAGGWGFDAWKGTNPTGLLIGLGVGFAMALYRIIRATQREEAQREQRKRGG